MEVDNKKSFELLQEIQSSPGTAFINNLYMRSFSLNILQRNALELMEEAKKVQDPDYGIPLMALANREAGNQAHRELSRHLHNFVSAAKTLVDHTRVFVEEHYANTNVMKAYQKSVETTFLNDGNAKFVHDLRNYMLHKGPPKTSMYFSYTNHKKDDHIQGEAETGIRFETKTLLEWSKWTAPAKKYIENSGKHISVHDCTESYLVTVTNFHDQLEALLYDYHADDLRKLRELQSAYHCIDNSERNHELASGQGQPAASSPITIGKPTSEEITFSEEEAKSIDTMCEALLQSLQSIELPATKGERFPTERPIEAKFSEADLINEPVHQGYDTHDRPYIALTRKGSDIYGLLDQDVDKIGEICAAILQFKWAQDKISAEFIEKEIIKWLRLVFHNKQSADFSREILFAANRDIKKLKVMIPIAHLEIESAFQFGAIRVEPVSHEKIEAIREMMTSFQPTQEEQVTQIIEKIRKDFQGYAAFIIEIKAEESAATDRSLKIAEVGIDILRFFAPAAYNADILSPIAILGSEILPRSKVLALSDSSFTMTDSLTCRQVNFWRASNSDIDHLKELGLEKAGHLIIPDNLNDFENHLRSSVIKYSKGLIRTDATDRLNYTIAAIESLLLKHEMEPITASIANRLSYIFSNDSDERVKYGHISRQAYKIRDKHKSLFRSPQEDVIVSQFTEMVYRVLCTALTNMHLVSTKASYIEAIDALKNPYS